MRCLQESVVRRLRRVSIPAGIALALGVSAGGLGCGKPRRSKKVNKLKQLAPCAKSGYCPGGGVCVKSRKGDPGICVKKCRTDRGCSEGFRCTGRYTTAGLAGFKFVRGMGYCQKADVAVGGQCSDLGHFCHKGQACWNGVCRKHCKGQASCDPKGEKCVRIVETLPKHLSMLKPKTLFRVCLPATTDKGAKCDGRKRRCRPGLQCFRSVCRVECKGASDCDAGQRCADITTRVGVFKDQRKLLYRACLPAARRPARR